ATTTCSGRRAAEPAMVMLAPTAYYRVGGDPIAIRNVRFSPAVFVECIGDNAYCLTGAKSWRSACAVDIRPGHSSRREQHCCLYRISNEQRACRDVTITSVKPTNEMVRRCNPPLRRRM